MTIYRSKPQKWPKHYSPPKSAAPLYVSAPTGRGGKPGRDRKSGLQLERKAGK